MTKGIKLALMIGAAVLALFILAGIGTWLADPFGWKKAELDTARSTAAQAQGQATVAGAETQAARDITGLADVGVQREATTTRTREKNRDRIVTAPGADAPLDRDLIRRANRGLCDYNANADHPDCVRLRAADPGQLSPPGSRVGPPH